jgi:hypothetical protein
MFNHRQRIGAAKKGSVMKNATKEIKRLVYAASASLPEQMLPRIINVKCSSGMCVVRPDRHDLRRKLIGKTFAALSAAISSALPGGTWWHSNEYSILEEIALSAVAS